MLHPSRSRTIGRLLLAGLFCACFLIQGLQYPLHLALHSHTFEGAAGLQEGPEVAHLVAPGHDHRDTHAHHDHEEGDECVPHPVEDHEDCQEPVAAGSKTKVLAMVLPGGRLALDFDRPACGAGAIDWTAPVPSCPRGLTPPRAPPIAS